MLAAVEIGVDGDGGCVKQTRDKREKDSVANYSQPTRTEAITAIYIPVCTRHGL